MYRLLFVIAFVICGCGCGSKEAAVVGSVPTNLTLSAVVSNDNSGNVTLTASATGATTYDFNFGNGAFQLVPTGTITYKYISSGTYTVMVIAKNATGSSAAKSVDVTVSVTATSASLIWSDEFNTPGAPDPTKWGYDIGTGSGGWGNNELQFYTNRSQNVIIENGVLKINAIKESFSGSNYTSARLLSKDKFSFKYGRIETRAKVPAGVGTWPAIWMLGSNFPTAGWPACGEIDIMEHRGMELNKIFATLHYPGNSGANGRGGTTTISNATTEFHNYKADWTATEIKFYVDDQLFFTFPNNNSIPFNQNFFFILNLAIGGNFAGPVAPSLTNATLEIDYIRVYQ